MITQYIDELVEIDNQYDTEEDKNYFLVHRTMELLAQLDDVYVNELRNQILNKFNYKSYSSLCEYVYFMSKKNISQNIVIEKNIKKDITKIENIIEFYNSYDEHLIRYIKGHLFLEFAINTIIEKALRINTKGKTFSIKIDILFKNSLLSTKEKNLLIAINKERNNIAHNLNYILTFDTVYNLAKTSADAGVDYSESTIYKNKKLSEEWYGVNGILMELFPNIFCHLFYKNEKYFEGNEILSFMC